MITLRWWLSIGLVIAMLLVSLVAYPSLPDRIPTHWNIKGEIDAYGSKTWAAFLSPALMLGLLGLFAVLPWLSPKHFEIDTFRSTYEFIVLVAMLYFAYVHVLTLMAAFDRRLDFARALVGGMFLFFALLGNVLGKVRRNFYVGVRVPWTLASERVWNDTHRVAAWLFVSCGLLGAILMLFGANPLLPCALLPIAVFVPIVYSFVHSKRLERRGEI
jgi:uncharacterized membrane protein